MEGGYSVCKSHRVLLAVPVVDHTLDEKPKSHFSQDAMLPGQMDIVYTGDYLGFRF